MFSQTTILYLNYPLRMPNIRRMFYKIHHRRPWIRKFCQFGWKIMLGKLFVLHFVVEFLLNILLLWAALYRWKIVLWFLYYVICINFCGLKFVSYWLLNKFWKTNEWNYKQAAFRERRHIPISVIFHFDLISMTKTMFYTCPRLHYTLYHV